MIPQLKILDDLLNESFKKMNTNGTVNISFPNAFADKLERDGYLIDTKNGDGDNNKYLVTLEGIIFIESGGYVQKRKNEIRTSFLQTLAIWVTAIGTGLAGIYALIQLMKMFCGY